MSSTKEIYVIDDRIDQSVGKFGALWGPVVALHTYDEATMTSADTMVDNVIAKLGEGEKIDILRIVDHGNRSSLQLGDDRVRSTNFAQFAPRLQVLRNHFNTPGGIAHFVGCHIGNNVGLMHQFAVLWNVTVYAGTGRTNGFEINLGKWVTVGPNGTITDDVSWPD